MISSSFLGLNLDLVSIASVLVLYCNTRGLVLYWYCIARKKASIVQPCWTGLGFQIWIWLTPYTGRVPQLTRNFKTHCWSDGWSKISPPLILLCLSGNIWLLTNLMISWKSALILNIIGSAFCCFSIQHVCSSSCPWPWLWTQLWAYWTRIWSLLWTPWKEESWCSRGLVHK